MNVPAPAPAGLSQEPAADCEIASPSKQPRSARRVLALLEQVAQSAEGMTLAELSAATQVPKSTVLTMVSPLVADGYLTQVNGRYLPNWAAFQLAGRILRHRRLNLLVRPYMDELLEAFRETVSLAVLDADTRQARYVEVVESDRTVRFVIAVGGQRPLYASASGRVLLAHQPKSWIEEYLASTPLKRLASQTTTDPEKLRAELREIREQGYAATDGTVVEDGGAISCPVFDHTGAAVAALAISAPRDRMQRNLAEWSSRLQQTARQVSAAL